MDIYIEAIQKVVQQLHEECIMHLKSDNIEIMIYDKLIINHDFYVITFSMNYKLFIIAFRRSKVN